MANLLFDTHAHLNDSRFDGVRDETIQSLFENGIGAYCEIGYDVASSKKAIELSKKYDKIYSSAGVHPHDTDSVTNSDLDEIALLCKDEKCVALGEIGLDYYYDNSKRENQKKWFDAQISLAESLNKCVAVHTRDAMKDTLDILKAHPDASGIIHCFSGSLETAKILLKMGWYISFAGPLTYKNANSLLEVGKYVPDDRFLIETDSPYLAPVPYRGKTNIPIYVAEVAKRLGELRGETFEKIAQITFENAMSVYGIK